jgi:hypothetical protein
MEKALVFSGLTFAIPTKDKNLNTLPLDRIKYYVDKFYDFAIEYDYLTFLVTEIGCGLAGYDPKDIAPLFDKFKKLNNIALPKRFIDILFEGV